MANQLRHSMAVLGLCTVVMFAGPASAEPNDGVEGLNEEQQAFAGGGIELPTELINSLIGLMSVYGLLLVLQATRLMAVRYDLPPRYRTPS